MIFSEIDNYGLKVMEMPSMVNRDQVKFPRSKKKRIQKKWRKDLCNYKITPSDTCYIDRVNGFFIGHPVTLREYLKHIPKRESLVGKQHPRQP